MCVQMLAIEGAVVYSFCINVPIRFSNRVLNLRRKIKNNIHMHFQLHIINSIQKVILNQKPQALQHNVFFFLNLIFQ